MNTNCAPSPESGACAPVGVFSGVAAGLDNFGAAGCALGCTGGTAELAPVAGSSGNLATLGISAGTDGK